jgi:hypothetical protein
MFVVYVAIASGPTITPSDVEAHFSEFYKRRNVNLRSGLVLTTAQPVLDELRYKALTRLWRRFKGAANRRTDVAHCVFMSKDGEDLMRLSSAASKPRFEPLEQSYFDRTTLQFRTLGRDILTFSTFVVGTEERLLQLLRALPLPPDMPFPPEVEGPQAPPDQHEKAEERASVSRLGLLPLYRE